MIETEFVSLSKTVTWDLMAPSVGSFMLPKVFPFKIPTVKVLQNAYNYCRTLQLTTHKNLEMK